MTRIWLNQRTTCYGLIAAGNGVTSVAHAERPTSFHSPNGTGQTTTSRMPVALTRSTPGTPLIDGRTPQQARPSPALGAVTDSAVSHPRRSGGDTPSRCEATSPMIGRRVIGLGLVTTAVLIFLIAVAAVYLAVHGGSSTMQQLVHAVRHLHQPLRALIGSRLFQLLN